MFLVLLPAGWIEGDTIMRFVELCATQIEDRSRTCQRIHGYHEIGQHVS